MVKFTLHFIFQSNGRVMAWYGNGSHRWVPSIQSYVTYMALLVSYGEAAAYLHLLMAITLRGAVVVDRMHT